MKNSVKITIVLITLISVFACCYMPYAIIQHKEEQSKPQPQTFTATSFIKGEDLTKSAKERTFFTSNQSFDIVFAEMEISDSMTDEEGNENISWSSSKEGIDLEVYTENGIITAVTEVESETGEAIKRYYAGEIHQ